MKFIKTGIWNMRDIYRFPIAYILSFLIKRNYRLRSDGKLKDEWYWADVKLMQWDYAVLQIDLHN